MGVTGCDGTVRLEFPFGRVFVAISRTVYVEEWLGAEEELDIVFHCTQYKKQPKVKKHR